MQLTTPLNKLGNQDRDRRIPKTFLTNELFTKYLVTATSIVRKQRHDFKSSKSVTSNAVFG